MRKYVVGAIVGATLMFGIQAGAASLVGSKVAGTKDVTLNGTTVGQAVIINNSSYLPVRSLSNALDLGINLSGGRINLSEQEQSMASSTPSPMATPTPTPTSRATVETIKQKKIELAQIKSNLAEVMLKKASSPNDPELIKQYDELLKQGNELDAEIKALEAQQ